MIDREERTLRDLEDRIAQRQQERITRARDSIAKGRRSQAEAERLSAEWVLGENDSYKPALALFSEARRLYHEAARLLGGA